MSTIKKRQANREAQERFRKRKRSLRVSSIDLSDSESDWDVSFDSNSYVGGPQDTQTPSSPEYLQSNSSEDEYLPNESSESDTDDEIYEDPIDSFSHDGVDYSPYLDEPLYANSDITVGNAMLLILYFVVTCNISVTCVSKLLVLIQYLIPSASDQLARTKHVFFKYFGDGVPTMGRYSSCEQCRKVFTSSVCPVCKSVPSGRFLCELPSVLLIRKLKDRTFWNKCQYFRDKYRYSKDLCNDIYDGTVYKDVGLPISLQKGGFNFILNTDGANKYKSSSWSVWPIYLIIAEMPPDERYKIENVIFCGLWYGGKPDMNIFLSFIVGDLKVLDEGKLILIDNEEILLRARLIGQVMDLPARASVYCMHGHMGSYACAFCLTAGEKINKRFSYWVQDQIISRTVENTEKIYEQLRKADDQSQVVKGIRDIPVLNVLPYWSMVLTDCIDAMHQIQGLFKTLTSLWSKSKFKSYSFYLEKSKWSKLSDIYSEQKNVSTFKRVFRSLNDHQNHFKAMEALLFMIYSTPILNEVMKEKYYRHHVLLVDCLTKLFGVISWSELDQIEVKLHDYVLQFQQLYGREFVSLNIHNLIHLAECVRRHGPLFMYTCYPFESFNRSVLAAIQGTNRCELQASRSIGMYQYIHERLQYVTDGNLLDAVRRMDRKVITAGSKKEMIDQISFATGFDSAVKGKLYYRSMSLRGDVYCSAALNDQKSTNDSVVRLKDGRFGVIQKIWYSSMQGWNVYLTLIQQSEMTEMIRISVGMIDCQCIGIVLNGRIHPKPFLPSFKLLLR